MARRYKQGTARMQQAMLPPRVEDYVGHDNAVRAIDAFVDTLDLQALGFKNSSGVLAPGQPAFDPAALLKLYLYGYTNRVHSSRRQERECRRNLEVIWLLEGLTPSYRTIAEFRRINGQALKAANREFVLLCKALGLLGGETIGIDGSFFNASASDASILTKKQLEVDLQQIERAIDSYSQRLDDNDAQEGRNGALFADDPKLDEKLEALKQTQARKQAQLKQLQDSGETQLSRTDPDARSLSKGKQHTVGYNVQSTVDAQHKLIVHHEVTNAGNDSQQLSRQCTAAMDVLGVDTLDAVADAGYYSETELAAAEAAGVSVYVPIPDKHKALNGQGRISGEQFHYNSAVDAYVCPAGELLQPSGQPQAKNGVLRTRYTRPASQCQDCPLQAVCLAKPDSARSVYRSEHAELVAAHRQRMAAHGAERMRQRAGLAEHPFGTLKRWFGWDHFLVRGFEKVRGEMSIMVLGYNLTRVINILGVVAFREYCARSVHEMNKNCEAAMAT
jgi:transposase